MDDRNPTARALRCLEVLSDHPGIGAVELAERLGVSERAARRYVAVLREADVPVESVRGRHGGYRLGRGHRTPLIFTTQEALALVMAVLDGHHAAADATEPVGKALGKLLRALPDGIAEQASAVRRMVSVAPDLAAARPDPATVTAVAGAVGRAHRIRLGYRSEAGRSFEVDVDPWALVVWRSRWYLLCRIADHDTMESERCFRVDRVVSVTALPQRAPRPPDLDPVERLEQNLASGWEYPVEVVIDASVAHVARWLPRSLGRVEAVEDHRSRLVATTGNPWFYAEQLVCLPVDYRIVGSPELRAAARTLAARLLAATQG